MANLLQLNKSSAEKVLVQKREPIPGYYRGFILDILTVTSALLLGAIYKFYASGDPLPYVGLPPNLSLLLSVLTFFFLASLFEVLLVRDNLRRCAVAALSVLALGLFLYDESPRWLTTEALALGIVLWGMWRVRSELDNTLQIHFFRVASVYYGKLVLAVALMAVIFYFPYWQTEKTLIPRSTFDQMVDWALGISRGFYDRNQTGEQINLEKAIEEIARQQIKNNFLTTESHAETTAEEEAYIKSVSVTVAKELNKTFGGEALQPQESLSDYLYRSMTDALNRLEGRFKEWFFIGWTVIALLVVLGIGRLFSFFVSAIAVVIFQLLLATNFVKIYNDTRSKELLDF